MNPRNFLVRGLLAGFIAGIVAFGVAHTVGEPAVDQAIAVEEAGSAPAPAVEDHEHAEGTPAEHSHADGEAVVSRANQSTWGLATATIAIGTAFGGLIALLAAMAIGRLGGLRPVGSTAVVAGTAFVAVALVPWIKYPPNPPATGSGDTIGTRTAEYFGFVAISVFAAVVAIIVVRKLLGTTTTFNAVAVGGFVYLSAVIIAGVLMPEINEVPDTFPANTLYSFRIGSIATQTALFGTIGVLLCGMIGHLFDSEQAKVERRNLVGTAI
ncbi:CbtA family protein [soil metagenome]